MACKNEKKILDNATGNKKEDWEIFDILCMQDFEVKSQ